MELSITATNGAYIEQTYTLASGEQKWQLTIPEKGNYKIELWGPASSSGQPGGYIQATGLFESGDTFYISAGPGAARGDNYSSSVATGGKGGSGYLRGASGNNGLYASGGCVGGSGGAGAVLAASSDSISKVDVRFNSSSWGNVILVAGGAGGSGGSGSPGGVGGAGGAGGHYTVIANGSEPFQGSAASSNGSKGGDRSSTGYSGAGGGGGGSNFIDCFYFQSFSTVGASNSEVAKFKISYAGEYVPSGTDETLMYMTQTLSQQMQTMTATIAKSSEAVPTITVIAGREFNYFLTQYLSIQTASAGGIEVVNSNPNDGLVEIKGTLSSPGWNSVIISGKQFLFNVLEEPDSGNVTVTFE